MKSFLFLLIFIAFNGFAFSQPPPSQGTTPQKNTLFTSLEGGFSIDIPQSGLRGYSGLRQREANGLGTGGVFPFDIGRAKYNIGYIDLSAAAQSFSQAEVIEKLKGLPPLILGYPLAIKGHKESSRNGNKVIELKLSNELPMSIRYILERARIYILMASYQEGEAAKVSKIFDSIRFFSREETIAKKLEEVTPPEFPAERMPEFFKSDAENEGLIGKVKFLREESEDLAGEWYSTGKKPDREEYYDKFGNLTRSVFYDHKGLPTRITVYGFIDGMRVSKFGQVHFESQPPAPMAVRQPGSKTEETSPDNRFNERYETKYDGENRRIEISSYSNTGKRWMKRIFTYSENRVMEMWYDREDKLIKQNEKTLDKKGNEISSVSFWTNGNGKYTYTYAYELFDSKGNWIKKLVVGSEPLYGGGTRQQKYIRYRTIAYYD